MTDLVLLFISFIKRNNSKLGIREMKQTLSYLINILYRVHIFFYMPQDILV